MRPLAFPKCLGESAFKQAANLAGFGFARGLSRSLIQLSVLIRNAADPDGQHVTMTQDEWGVFLAGVKDGDFDGL